MRPLCYKLSLWFHSMTVEEKKKKRQSAPYFTKTLLHLSIYFQRCLQHKFSSSKGKARKFSGMAGFRVCGRCAFRCNWLKHYKHGQWPVPPVVPLPAMVKRSQMHVHKNHTSISSLPLTALVTSPGHFPCPPQRISKHRLPPTSSMTYSLPPKASPTISLHWLAAKPSVPRRVGNGIHPVTQLSVSTQAAVRKLWGRCIYIIYFW